MTRDSAIVIAVVIAGFLAMATPARAVDWPWCADMYDPGGTATNCGFASQAQCEESISGMSGWCYPNPRHRKERRPRQQRY